MFLAHLIGCMWIYISNDYLNMDNCWIKSGGYETESFEKLYLVSLTFVIS